MVTCLLLGRNGATIIVDRDHQGWGTIQVNSISIHLTMLLSDVAMEMQCVWQQRLRLLLLVDWPKRPNEVRFEMSQCAKTCALSQARREEYKRTERLTRALH
jgi:hypothetical protein